MNGSLEGIILAALVFLSGGLGFACVRLLAGRGRDAERFSAGTDELKNQKAALESRLSGIEGQTGILREQLSESNRKNEALEKKIETLEGKIETLKQGAEAEALKSAGLARDLDHAARRKAEAERELEVLRGDRTRLSEELVALKEQEPIRIKEHDQYVTRLNESIANLEKERDRDRQAKEQAEAARLSHLRETWQRHEKEVEEKMRLICKELLIEYIPGDKFPHRGKPDNCVLICNEHIIFDGKSPQNDDLSNFPAYVKTQAEQAEKYAKFEGVKKDVFLVVPTNAIHVLDNTCFTFSSHRVHAVTIDSLRPILIQLKKVESYEFAKDLSPEDRDKIANTIGRMAHGMKRRVQVDHFFSNEFISILTDAENLPEEILESARKVEQASLMNPGQHKRSKKIDVKVLDKEAKKLGGKLAGQEIHTGAELRQIEALPLYTSEAEGEGAQDAE